MLHVCIYIYTDTALVLEILRVFLCSLIMNPLSIFILIINPVLFWSHYSSPDFYGNVSSHLMQCRTPILPMRMLNILALSNQFIFSLCRQMKRVLLLTTASLQ